MVFLTGVSVATALKGPKGTDEAAKCGVGIGIGAASVGTAASVGGATGAGMSAGAITGAISGGTIASAVQGALAGGTAASGVSLSGYAGLSLGAAVSTCGVGLLVVGIEQESCDCDKLTYDCWKPVVHEMSEKPSDGMLLKDLVCHPHVAKYTMTQDGDAGLPYIVVENIWEEKFEIQYFVLHDSGKLVGHANPLIVTDSLQNEI